MKLYLISGLIRLVRPPAKITNKPRGKKAKKTKQINKIITFHSSACRLWNALDPEPKTLSHTNFKNYLFKLYRSLISSLDHFKICKTF